MFLLYTLLGLLPSATAALPALGAPPGPIDSVGTCPPPAYHEPGKPRLDEFQHLCDGWCADPTIGLKDPNCKNPYLWGNDRNIPSRWPTRAGCLTKLGPSLCQYKGNRAVSVARAPVVGRYQSHSTTFQLRSSQRTTRLVSYEFLSSTPDSAAV